MSISLYRVCSVFSKDVSPGPKYAIDPRYTRAGPEGEPKYSMLARQPEPSKYRTTLLFHST